METIKIIDNSSISFFHEFIESKHSQSKLHWKRGFGKYINNNIWHLHLLSIDESQSNV